jgi:hypothetical protein
MASLTQTTTTASPPQFLSPAEQEIICHIILAIALVLPVSLGLAMLIHDQYASYRSARLKQQIEQLERIWQRTHQS